MLGKIGRGAELLGSAMAALPGLPAVRELARKEYTPRSTHFAANKLEAAADAHVDSFKPGASLNFDVTEGFPQGESFGERFREVLSNPTGFAGSTSVNEKPAISINPKASRELYAHELGHLASQQGDVGHFIASMRANPNLKNALFASMLTVPGLAAAMEDGTGDMDTSMALAALAAAPTIADEALATRHGLAIMDRAGMRATLGQRGRLAGGLLSYLAAPLAIGAAANVGGNVIEGITD